MTTVIGLMHFTQKYVEIQNWIKDMEERMPPADFDPFEVSLTDLRQRMNHHDEFMRGIKSNGESHLTKIVYILDHMDPCYNCYKENMLQMYDRLQGNMQTLAKKAKTNLLNIAIVWVFRRMREPSDLAVAA